MKNLIVLSVILMTAAQARVVGLKNADKGDWGSGGGNAVVCFSPPQAQPHPVEIIKKNKNIIPDELLIYINSIEMFDLYEAKKPRGLGNQKSEIIKINSHEDYYKYIDRLSKRFTKYVRPMKVITDHAMELVPDSNFIFHNAAVEHQNDLGNVVLSDSENCLIITVAAQVNYNDYFEVHIDNRLFNHNAHSKQSKATLILHELLYAYGRKYPKHTDSGATRKLVKNFISYSPFVTNGSVSKDLYTLGFWYLKERNLYSKEFNYNWAANDFSLYVEGWQDILMSSYINSYTFMREDLNTLRLYNDLRELYDTHGWDLPVFERIPGEIDKNNTLLFIQEMINSGKELLENEALWNSYDIRLLTSYRMFQVYFKQQTFSDLEEMVWPDIINLGSGDNKVLEYLKEHAKYYFMDLEYRISGQSSAQKTYINMMDFFTENNFDILDKKLIDPLSSVFRDEVCDESNQCVPNLELTSIIPKN